MIDTFHIFILMPHPHIQIYLSFYNSYFIQYIANASTIIHTHSKNIKNHRALSQRKYGFLFGRIKQLNIPFDLNLLREDDSPIDACPLPDKADQDHIPEGDCEAHVHGENGECEVEVVAGIGV